MRKTNYPSQKSTEVFTKNFVSKLQPDAKVNNSKMMRLTHWLTSLFILAFSFSAHSQISVTATAGNTTGSYSTLKVAFDSINSGYHQGVITISVNGNTTETATASLNTSASPSSYTSVTVKPTGTFTITGNLTGAAVVKLNGAKNVTIDGSSTVNGTTRDLTITNTAASGSADNATVIWVAAVSSSNAATGNTVKNCKISGVNRTVAYAAIFSGGSSIGSTPLGSNNNNTYSNNLISRARNGILAAGIGSTPYDANTTISNNNVDSIGNVAITMSNQTNYNIFGNVFDKCEGAASYAANMRGISLTSYQLNGNIYNNTFKMLRCPYAAGGGAVANYFNLSSTNTASNISVYNNNCSGAWCYGTASNISIYAVNIGSGGGYKIYHNSFQVNETPTTTNTFQIMLAFQSALTTANSIDIRNNIFSINNNATNNYVVYDFHTAANASQFRALFANSDNNAYYTNGTTFGYGIGGVISDYKVTTQKDANSVFPTSSNPFSFVSSTDAHLQLNSSNALLNNGGTPISTVTTDVDGDVRSRIYPDIGCDEIVYIPKISGFTPASACIGNTVSIYGADLNASGSTVSLAGASPASSNLYRTDTISAVVASGYTSPNTDVVTVTNSYGTGTSSSSLTRVAPATFVSKSLSTGSVGDQVTITGTNLNGATAVTFNGTSASFSISNSTEIVATVPSGATTGNVVIADACGNSVNAGSFTVVAANPCTTPATQGTNFVASSTTSTGVTGAFTVASGSPSGYLVIYSNTALVAAPSDGTTYSAGYNASLGGTVKQVSASTNVSVSGLASNTTYTVTIYSYNGGGCTGGPLYNRTSPLTYTFTTCSSVPTAVTATPVVSSGVNQATISWTAPTGGGANSLSYNVELYSDAAFTSLVNSYTTTAVSQVFTPLNFDTKYYYRVRSNNGCNSSYATGNFTTLCGSGTVLPATQNFDASTNLPNCWTTIDNNADGYTWYISTPFNATGLGNPYVLDYDVNSTNTSVIADDWAITPGFQLQGGVKYAVSFLQATSGATENLSVKWGNAATVAGMSATNNSGVIWSGTSLSNRAAAARFGTFTPSSTGTYYIGFYTNSPAYAGNPAGRYHYVDNFKIEQAPAAPTTPSNISFTNVTSSSVTVNWTDNSNNEEGFYVYISTDGGNTYTLATTVGANITSATIGNLNANTQYYFRVSAYNYGDESSKITGSTTTLSCGGVYTTNTYTGTFPIGYGARKLWSTAANWSLGRAPLACDDVVITLSNTNIDTTSTSYSSFYLDQNATVHSLTINGTLSKPRNNAGSAQTLIIFTDGYSLNVTGDLNMSLDTSAGTATGQHGVYLLCGAGTGGTASQSKVSVSGNANIGVTGTRACYIGGFVGANKWYFYGDVNFGPQSGYNYAELSDFYFEKGGNQTLTSNSTRFFTPLSSYGIYNFNVGTINATNLTMAGSSTAYSSRIVENITVGTGSSLSLPSGTFLNRTQGGGGTFTLGSGATLTVSGTTLGVTGSNFPGNFNTYAFNNSSNVVFNGTSAQTVPSAATYGNLTVNNNAGVTLNGNTSVNNVLTLTNGKVTTGSNKITLGASGSLSGANSSKYINGTLEKTIGAAVSNASFEIGDASNYTPVSVSFAGGSTNSGGKLSAKTTSGTPAALGYLRSGISSANYLNRTYTLVNTGVTGFTSISPTFNYVSGDLIGNSSNASYNIADSVYGGGWAIRSTTNSTGTSSSATGASLASGASAVYLLGEIDPAPIPTVDNLVSTSLCEGTSFTVTGTNFYAINSVAIGSTSVPFTVNSPTQITVTIPALTGNGAVTVSNASGSASTTNSLTIKAQPQTTVMPPSQTICSGAAIANITVGNSNNVSGTIYSWTRSGNNISGGTNTSTGNGDITGTIESSSTIPETITYTVTSSANGCTGTTATATVTVKASPGTVNVTPASAAICQNVAQDLTGSYDAATGSSTTNSGTISVAIPDANVAGANTTLSVTDVPSGAIVTGIEVKLSATHARNSDLSFNLVAPNGKIINLSYQKGGTGANYLNTVFSDVSFDALPTANTNNITGTYMPDGLIPVGSTLYPSNTNVFSDLYSTPNGTWRLVARDYTSGSTGSITNFSVKLYYTLNPTFSWSKVGGGYSGLYTDAGFTPYTGGNQSVVYVKNTAGTYNYTANLTFNGCTASSTPVTIEIDPVPVTSRTPASQTVCSGDNITNIVFSSSDASADITWTRDHTSDISGIAASGTSGTISGSLINTTAAPITVTFTGTSNGIGNAGCAGNSVTATVTVNPVPLASVSPSSQTVCSGTPISPLLFNTTNGVAGTTFAWTRNNTSAATGINASGTAFVSGTLTNTGGNTTVTFNITAVGPSPSFCSGTPATATVTVNNSPTVYNVTGSGNYCTPGASGKNVGLSGSQTGVNYQLYKDGSASGSPVAGTGSALDFGILTTGTYTVTAMNGCNVNMSGSAVITSSSSGAASISISTATTSVCSGSYVAFSSSIINGGSTPSYQWKKNGTPIADATGSTYTAAPGSLATNDVISCSLTSSNICASPSTSNSNGITLTVLVSPAIKPIEKATVIISNLTICTLNTAYTLTCRTQGGSWSSNNPSVATVSNSGTINGGTANVYGINNGTAIISYSLPPAANGCSSTSSIVVTVANVPAPNPVSGPATLCIGVPTLYTTTSTNGVWSTGGRSTITSGGSFTATSSGNTSAIYTITNGYGCTGVASLNITINPTPAAPSIAFITNGYRNPYIGAPSGSMCTNRTFGLEGYPSGGVWGATGVASTTSAGIVTTGPSAGPFTISYTVTSLGCSNTRTVPGTTATGCAPRGIANNTTLSSSTTFNMYPNPARNIVNIQVDRLVGEGQIIVTNILGKQVLVQPLSMGTNSMNVAGLSKGVYMVSIITSTGKNIQKLVKE